MARTLILAALTLVAIGGLLVGAPDEAEAHVGWKGWRWNKCKFQSLESGTWTPREVKQTIRCAAKHWKVPGGAKKALSVARCESGFRAHAYAAGNAGVFQQRVRYWDDRWERWGVIHRDRLPSSVYNGRSNSVVSIRMAHSGGWSAWACA